MPKAICPACGQARAKPWLVCKGCGLDPSQDDELLIRSVYLSVDRFEDGSDRARYAKELEGIAKRLSECAEYSYDTDEIERLRKQKLAISSVPDSAVWGAVFRLFLPAIFVFIALAIILYLKRR